MLTKFFTKKIPRATIELKNIVKNYFETSFKSSKVCSSKIPNLKEVPSRKVPEIPVVQIPQKVYT